MAAPPNTTCATAEVLDLPATIAVDTTEAPADPSVPDNECGSGDSFNAVWYSYTVPLDGSVRQLKMTLNNPADNCVITVFKGPDCGALALLDPDCDFDCSCVYQGFPITWPAEPGQTYFFLLTSFDEGGDPDVGFDFGFGTPSGDFCAMLECQVELVITGLTYDCDTHVFTVAGGTFSETGFALRVRRGDTVLTPTVLAVSANSITFTIAEAFVNETYCVEVDVDGQTSNEYCAALSCEGGCLPVTD